MFSRGLCPLTLLPEKVGPCAVTAATVVALNGIPSATGAVGLGFRRRAVIICADLPLDVDESFEVLLWKASGRTASFATAVSSVATSSLPFAASSLGLHPEPPSCAPLSSELRPQVTSSSTRAIGIGAAFSRSGVLAAFSVSATVAALLIAF